MDAFDPFLSGSSDGFFTKLSPDGGDLVYSTFLGGSSGDRGWGLALDDQDRVCVVGSASEGFPTTPDALDPVGAGFGDAFIVLFSRLFRESGDRHSGAGS
jgi:hypothetical protein